MQDTNVISIVNHITKLSDRLLKFTDNNDNDIKANYEIGNTNIK